MGHRYQHIAFGPTVVDRQRRVGSVTAYGAGLDSPDTGAQELGSREVALLTSVFQFHLATVTSTGWPYVQYRSGPRGFLHHLGGNRIGFAEFPGNRQFVSLGNIDADGRVALFVADLPVQQRLKVFGRARVVEADDDPDLALVLRRIGDREMATRSERGVVIDVEGFDWNCSRSLIPQYTTEQVRARVQPYIDEIASLHDEIAALRARVSDLEAGVGSGSTPPEWSPSNA